MNDSTEIIKGERYDDFELRELFPVFHFIFSVSLKPCDARVGLDKLSYYRFKNIEWVNSNCAFTF